MRQAYSRDWTESRRLKKKPPLKKRVRSSRPATIAGEVKVINIVTGEVRLEKPYDRLQLNRVLRGGTK